MAKDITGKDISCKDKVEGKNGKVYIVSSILPPNSDGVIECVCMPEEGLAEQISAGELKIVASIVQDLLSLKTDEELEMLLAGLKMTPLTQRKSKKSKGEGEPTEKLPAQVVSLNMDF